DIRAGDTILNQMVYHCIESPNCLAPCGGGARRSNATRHFFSRERALASMPRAGGRAGPRSPIEARSMCRQTQSFPTEKGDQHASNSRQVAQLASERRPAGDAARPLPLE